MGLETIPFFIYSANFNFIVSLSATENNDHKATKGTQDKFTCFVSLWKMPGLKIFFLSKKYFIFAVF